MENRQWRLRTYSGKTDADYSELIQSLQQATGLSPLALRVCVLRGLDTPQAIHAYFVPKLENLQDPFSLKDMLRVVERFALARQRNEAIRIFGDYDVDGTTGAALLTWVFRDMGFRHEARQPDRFKDGYGLNVGAVEEAARDGAKIMVTVDCGISSFEAAQRAQELGMDLIVLDHHQVDPTRGVPPAYAIVNPQQADCGSGLKQLCGCGLAFYFAIALRSWGRREGWFASGLEPNLKQHLDLVVMATAADMVPLLGDNHILVSAGLGVLKHSRKPGVKALMDSAGLSAKEFSPSHLGFVLGPRINASGRMNSASLALELLTTTDSDRAAFLAQELERLNQERADVQNQIWDEVRIRVEQGIAEGRFRHGVVVADSGWHEGVVGIVASRVTETFRRPAIVISLREDFGKGSVRSFGGKDVLAALRNCAEHLLGFGGHRHAAGVSVSLDRVDALAESFDQALEALPEDTHGSCLWVEGACSLDELNVKSLQELERLGPFGPGNPEPVFTVKALPQYHRILKGRHLKLNLVEKNAGIEAIWFYGAERKDMEEFLGEGGEWAGVPELNRFRGQVTPSLRVRDWREVENE